MGKSKDGRSLGFLMFSPCAWKSGKISAFPALEQGIYLNLIINAWVKQGDLEINEYLFSRQMGVSVEHLNLMLREFEKCGLIVGGRIKFVEEQLEAIGVMREKRRDAVNKRWGNVIQENEKNKKTDTSEYKCITHVRVGDTDKTIQDNTKQDKTPLKVPPKGFVNVLEKEMGQRLGKLYNRRENTAWSEKELKSLKKVCGRDGVLDELEEIEKFYNSGYQYFRRDIFTLLNNWTGELDKARLVEKPKEDLGLEIIKT